jgi:hypothetical protein
MNFRTVLKQSCAVFCENFWICNLWINVFVEICGLATWGLVAHLRICGFFECA